MTPERWYVHYRVRGGNPLECDGPFPSRKAARVYAKGLKGRPGISRWSVSVWQAKPPTVFKQWALTISWMVGWFAGIVAGARGGLWWPSIAAVASLAGLAFVRRCSAIHPVHVEFTVHATMPTMSEKRPN